MKTIICGSREFTDYALFSIAMEEIAWEISEVVSGLAKGPDTMAIRWATERNIPVAKFPANWDKFGNSAGYRRNKEMAEYSDAIVAFWDNESTGTKHMIKMAEKYNLMGHVFSLD